ncbi:transcriptional regulator MntR [Robertmurraya sp. GLU-23]
MPTPSMEDYIEKIYLLIQNKGYARVSDIANVLGVNPSSVTKMVQKLDQNKYLIYEKYRGIILTPYGQNIGKQLVYRHELLESLFRIIGVDEDLIYEEVERIEHHLSLKTLDCINGLVQFFEEDEQRIKALKEIHRKYKR